MTAETSEWKRCENRDEHGQQCVIEERNGERHDGSQCVFAVPETAERCYAVGCMAPRVGGQVGHCGRARPCIKQTADRRYFTTTAAASPEPPATTESILAAAAKERDEARAGFDEARAARDKALEAMRSECERADAALRDLAAEREAHAATRAKLRRVRGDLAVANEAYEYGERWLRSDLACSAGEVRSLAARVHELVRAAAEKEESDAE